MKYKTVLATCLIIFGLTSCQKEDSYHYKSAGIITGQDLRMCPSPCCSGWFIVIESLTYEFDSLPGSSDIDLEKEIYPLAVKLDWQFSDIIDCPNKRIIILKIAKE
jgi:hypothetical protein